LKSQTWHESNYTFSDMAYYDDAFSSVPQVNRYYLPVTPRFMYIMSVLYGVFMVVMSIGHLVSMKQCQCDDNSVLTPTCTCTTDTSIVFTVLAYVTLLAGLVLIAATFEKAVLNKNEYFRPSSFYKILVGFCALAIFMTSGHIATAFQCGCDSTTALVFTSLAFITLLSSLVLGFLAARALYSKRSFKSQLASIKTST
jgi:hypothetical protein